MEITEGMCMNNPKFKLHQWVYNLSRVECLKIKGVRWVEGNGITVSSGWVYYDGEKQSILDESSECDLTDSFEELKKHAENKLNKKLASCKRVVDYSKEIDK